MIINVMVDQIYLYCMTESLPEEILQKGKDGLIKMMG